MRAIDLFAGVGGFSTRATLAGCDVVWAANHWPDAVEWNAINHPGAHHICQVPPSELGPKPSINSALHTIERRLTKVRTYINKQQSSLNPASAKSSAAAKRCVSKRPVRITDIDRIKPTS